MHKVHSFVDPWRLLDAINRGDQKEIEQIKKDNAEYKRLQASGTATRQQFREFAQRMYLHSPLYQVYR